MRSLNNENKKITDVRSTSGNLQGKNYDESLAVKCINGTFVGKKTESNIAFKGRIKWMMVTTFVCCGLLFLACANNDNNAPDISALDLCHIRALHWDYDNQMHVGEMVCNKQIAERVVNILRQLFDAKYPIERMLLPDVYDADDETQMRDNNSSCFCYRAIAGSTKLSKHARGLAIDINTLYNPYIKTLDDGTLLIQPATGEPYCDRSWDFPYKLDHEDLCFRLFTEAGFEWGGDWTTRKDYQHFELIE